MSFKQFSSAQKTKNEKADEAPRPDPAADQPQAAKMPDAAVPPAKG